MCLRLVKQSVKKFIVALFIAVLAAAASFAENPDTSYHRPVAVETLSYVDVHSFHHGSSIFVKLKMPWEGMGCYLFNGQVLQARVEMATPRGKGNKESRLAISFRNVPCVGNKSTMNLVLAAVEWEAGVTKIPSAQYPMVNYGMAKTGSVSSIQRSLNMGVISMMAMSQQPTNRIPLRPGDVLGIDGVTLDMGDGPERSSILKSSTRDVHLEKESLLLLVPESIAFPKGYEPGNVRLMDRPSVADSEESSSPTDADISLKASSLPPIVEFQPCEPPACAVDLPSNDGGMQGAPSRSIGIRELGYAPRPQQQLEDLNDEVALAWLGPHQLLVAFNPHALIERNTKTLTGTAVRRIHAVALDPGTSKVLRVRTGFFPTSANFCGNFQADALWST